MKIDQIESCPAVLYGKGKIVEMEKNKNLNFRVKSGKPWILIISIPMVFLFYNKDT